MSRATPRLRMFAGPNGSGKSTIKAVVEDEIGADLFGVYINADDIEREIKHTGYLDASAYGVHTTAEEVLGFFRNSPFLSEKNLSDDAARLTFADGKLLFNSASVNSYLHLWRRISSGTDCSRPALLSHSKQ